MKFYKYAWLPFCFIVLSGCATHQKLARQDAGPADPRAIDHFVEGVLFDGEQNFPAAMLSYHEALIYDQNSSDLFLALGRDYFRVGKDETAYYLLRRVIELNPDELEALEILGRIYTDWQHYTLAEGTFQSIIQKDSTYLNAYYHLGLIYLQRNDYQRAVRMFEQIRALEPIPNPQVLLSLGDLYLDNNDAENAMSVYEQLAEQEPTEGLGHLGMGLTLESQGDTARAVDHYVKALHLSPDLNKARERLATLLAEKERWDDALKLYQEAWQRDSTDINALLQMGEIQREKGDTLAAIAVFEQIKQQFPEDWRGFINCGRMYLDQQKFQLAYDNFLIATQQSPETHLGWVFAGISLVHMDSLKASMPFLKKAIELNANDPLANYYLGSTLDRLEQSQKAIPYLQAATRMRPTWITAITALASAYDNLKQFAFSDSLYQIALRLDNENPLVLNNYGYSLSLQGIRLEQAMSMVQHALQLEPDNGAYLDTAGWIYYQLENYEAALQYIEKATEIETKSWTVMDHLGDVLLKLGDTTKAQEAWQKALEMDPDNEILIQKLNQATDK